MTSFDAIQFKEYINKTTVEKFWEKVKKPEDLNKCWLWQGARKDKTKENSYGVVGLQHNTEKGKFKTALAHRVSYFLATNQEPPATVDHICFNRNCVNPAHLRSLSWSENSSIHKYHSLNTCRKGHLRTPENTTFRRGSDKPLCLACERERDKARYQSKYANEKLKYNNTGNTGRPKLTWEQVCEIRSKYAKKAENGCSQSSLAVEYGVTKGSIQQIVNNKTRLKK